MFIDVEWDKSFSPLSLNRPALSRITVCRPNLEKIPRILSRYLISRIPYPDVADFAAYASTEGQRITREHVFYERNALLSKARKKLDQYACKACDTDFTKAFGGSFRDIVQTHHLVPLASKKPRITTMRDLVTLCPTCHAIIHKRKGREDDLVGLRNLIAPHHSNDHKRHDEEAT